MIRTRLDSSCAPFRASLRAFCPASGRVVVLAGVCLALAACGTSDDSRRILDAPRLTEGIITFHDPEPQVRSGQPRPRRLQPTTIVVTTRTREGQTVDNAEEFVGASGKVENQSVRDRLLKAASRHERVVSTEQFAELWDNLVEADLLSLPKHGGATPPSERAYIRVQAEGREIILLKPVEGFRERRSESEIAQTKAWHLAKVLLTSQ